jgi:hypothetical protein
VSPLWRDEIRVWFAPGELRLRRLRRGIRAVCVADAAHPVDSTSDWQPAFAALAGCLDAGGAWSGAPVRVVVSNRLARYAIVPWSDTLTREPERLAHARICLADTYGNTGSEWRVSLSEAEPGARRVACALPEALVRDLRALFDAHRLSTLSVQPALIAAYNRCRHLLPENACWFVNIEPGALVAARLVPGGWESVYSARIGADWATELLRLRTFARLAAQNSADGRVFVDAPKSLRQVAGPGESGIEWLDASGESLGADAEDARSLRLST